MKPSPSLILLLLFSTALFHSLTLSSAATCHVDDHQALLAFKSGITHDPSRMIASWKPTTHCCKWEGVTCSNSSRVETIHLSGNLDKPDSYLSGTISPSLSKLRYLTTLYLLNLRNLSGPFPEVLFRFPRLRDVRMDGSQLSGPLPRDIGSLIRVEVFSFAGNRSSGPIPASISKMTSLTNLVLNGNLLTGPIPDGIKMLKNLIELNLGENQITGNIPDFFSSFTQLRHVYLSNNKLAGHIPATVANLPNNLYYFEVANNALTGEIPSFFGRFQDLLKLDLSRNRFHGTVPKSFENMTMLGNLFFINLNLSYNNLAGPVPAMNKDRMSQIDMSYNGFDLGAVPEWILAALSLNSVGLARCGIKMNLDSWRSSETLNTYFLYSLDVSENEISGSPVTLFNASSFLREFRASGNKLEFNMGKLKVPKAMTTLDLSRNLVFGKLPKSVARVENLDVSYNHLCGQIPVSNHSASAFLGNDCLCGSPLPPCDQ